MVSAAERDKDTIPSPVSSLGLCLEDEVTHGAWSECWELRWRSRVYMVSAAERDKDTIQALCLP